MKKIIFSLPICFLLISISLINGCDYEKPVETGTGEGPGVFASSTENIYIFIVKEYVLVTPPPIGERPFYEYRTIGEYITTNLSPIMHTSYFTTPPLSRYENGNLVETQNYYLERQLTWNCIEMNRSAIWKLDGLGFSFDGRKAIAPETEECGQDFSSGTFAVNHNNFNMPEQVLVEVNWGLSLTGN